MRRVFSWMAGTALVLLLAAPALAVQVPFTGVLSIKIGDDLPRLPIPGSGTAEVAVGPEGGFTLPGGAFATVTIPAGAFATAITAPVPNAFPIVQLKLAGLQNGEVVLRDGTTCTADHPNVFCPGGGLAGFGGLAGSAIVGIFGTFGSPGANLSVPLSVVGGGSMFMTTDPQQGIMVTVSGAGWTTYSAQVIAPTAVVHVSTGELASQTATVMTPSTRTFSGYRTPTPDGGVAISLVSPVQVFNNATSQFAPSLARLTLTLPEPGAPLLVLSALAAIVGLYGLRRLRG